MDKRIESEVNHDNDLVKSKQCVCYEPQYTREILQYQRIVLDLHGIG